MKILAWIRERRRIRKQSQVLAMKCTFPTDVSIITCSATDCYFNRAYKGELTCDLKEVQLGKIGLCADYRARKESK